MFVDRTLGRGMLGNLVKLAETIAGNTQTG
jgi:hypothetical protein